MLRATFDWNLFTRGVAMESVPVPYEVSEDGAGDEKGLKLRVSGLKHAHTPAELERLVTSEVMDMIEPPLAIEGTRIGSLPGDPGFRVVFGAPGTLAKVREVGSEIIDRYIARATFEIEGARFLMRFEFRGEEPRVFRAPIEENRVGVLRGEVR